MNSYFLDVNYAIEQLNNENTDDLLEFLNILITYSTTTPNLASNLAQAPEIVDPLINSLMAGYDEEITIQLIRAIASIFPISGDNQIEFIDNGLTNSLYDLFSSDSIPLLESVISLVDVIAECSEYANESLLCMGIHDLLISTALSKRTENLTNKAANTLSLMFSYDNEKEPIDFDVVASTLPSLAPLLDLDSLQVIKSTLKCLHGMTNQYPILNRNIYELGLFPIIVGYLRVPELVSEALKLIGNLCICQDELADSLLNLGLLEILIDLTNKEEYNADLFWSLSNLVASVPIKTIHSFSHEFIEKLINDSLSACFDVRKEEACFLATFCLFANEEKYLTNFMNDRFLNLMLNMLDYNNAYISLKCLDAIIRLARLSEHNTLYESFHRSIHHDDFLLRLNGLKSNINDNQIIIKIDLLFEILNN